MAANENDIPEEGPGQEEDAASEPSTANRVLRVVAITAASLIGAVIFLLGLFVLALQTNRGGGEFADFLLTIANPFSEAYTEYGQLEGNFISRVEFHDLRIYRIDTVYVDTLEGDPVSIRYVRLDSLNGEDPAAFDTFYRDTLQMAAIDTLRLRYDLLALLSRRVHFDEISVSRPVLRARQRPDSTWDILAPFTSPDTAQAGGRAFAFEIDSLSITDGDLFAIFDPPDPDSVFRVERFHALARDVVIGDDVEAVLDTLHAAYAPPGRSNWTQLNAGGSLQDDILALTGLELSSAQSLLTAHGSLQLPATEQGRIEQIDFTLDAEPIDFRDLHPFLPSVNPNRSATLSVRATGSTAEMNLDLSGNLSDGGSVAFDGVVTPVLNGPLRYRGELQMNGFDPSFFTSEGPPAMQLDARVDLDLAGGSLEELEGTAVARFERSRFGDIEVASARIDADLAGGVATLDVTSNWNGGLLTADGTIRPFDETPSYEIDGSAEHFNLAALGMANQSSDLTGTFSLDGYGFDPQTAEVDGRIDVAPSTVNGYRMDDGQLQFALAGGDLTYGFRFLFPDGLLVANGDATLDDPLSFEVQRGRFQNVDVAALLGTGAASSVTGSFTAQGTGTDPLHMTAGAALTMEPSTYGAYHLRDAELRLDLANGRLSISSQADFAELGQFDLQATTRPFDDVPIVNVTDARFTGVGLAALLQNPEQSGELNGSASLTVRGFEPETMVLNGSVRLRNTTINEQAVETADVQATLTGGRLTFDADVTTPEGRAMLAGTAQPFLGTPTYAVTDGSFENVDLAALTGNPSLNSQLSGTLAVEGTGFDLETMHLQGGLTLAASRINDQQIDSASVQGSVTGGVFDLDMTLDVPQGSTELSGTVRPFLATPTYEIRRGAFSGINLGALTGNPDLTTNLTGTIALDGRGFQPDSMQATGALELAASTINGVPVRQGRLEGSLTDGLARFTADVAFEDGSANVSGQGRPFDAEPTYDLDGTLANVRVGDLIGADTLEARVSAAFDVTGRGTNPRTMRLQGRVSSGDAVVEGATVDSLYSQFLLSDGVLTVDSLLLRSTALDASGSGVIAAFDSTAASDFRFTADVKDLRPVRPFLAAQQLSLDRGRIEGRIYGQPGTVRFDVTGTVTNLIYDNVRLSEFEGTLAGEFDPNGGLTIAEVDGDFQAISLPQFLIDQADMSVSYTPDGLRFAGDVVIERGRTATLEGFVETGPDAQRIVLETFDLTLDGDEWELLQPATITYGDAYRVSNLLLYSGDQQLAIDGVIDPNGTQNLILTLESFEIDAVADLLGYEGLGGTVNGSITMTGPAAAPVMTGMLNTDVTSEGSAVGRLRLGLDYADLRLNVDALLTHRDGSTLEAAGYVPLDLRVARIEAEGLPDDLAQGAVDLTVAADSFGMGWIEPFLDPESVDEFDGRFTADIQVGGTMDSPILDGSARYTNGSIGLPELGLTYRGIQADLALDENVVQVSNLLIRSGDGRIRGDGSINLAQLTLGEFNIRLDSRDFLAIESQEFRFVIDGDMQLSGTTVQPRLQGDVNVISGEILLTDETTGAELEQVTLSTEQLQTVERRFGIHVSAADTTTFSLYNALAMDLNVSIERNTWIRSQVNPIMDIQFSGDLDLTKNHYQDVNMFGTIEVVPQRSRIIQFGKRFDITSGTLTFNGAAVDPYIDVEAQYEPRGLRNLDRGVTITLSIEGRMSEQLDLTLGSDPQLEYTDIVSYIATGQPASESLYLGGAGNTLIGAGTGLAFGQLTAIVEGIAEAGLGLDVVTLEQRPTGEFLTAGSYVTPRLFVSVSQPVNLTSAGGTVNESASNRPMITVEYEIQNWLLAQLSQQNQGLRLNLQFEYAY